MRLNKTQKYAINWLASQDKEVSEIVKELKLQINTVQNYIDKHLNTQNTTDKNMSSIKSKELMIRHTSNKNNNTVAIMTKEASEVNDEVKKNPVSKPSKTNKNIFRIS